MNLVLETYYFIKNTEIIRMEMYLNAVSREEAAVKFVILRITNIF